MLAVASGLALLVLLECALALFGYHYDRGPSLLVIWAPREDQLMSVGQGLHSADERQLWKPRAQAEVSWAFRETINSQGFRGRTMSLARAPASPRVAALGDSSTFGLGVEADQTWPALLEWLLAGRGFQAEVMNAGVIGFTLEQGLSRYRELVRPFHPDVVVAAFGAVNEAIGARGLSDAHKIALGDSRSGLSSAAHFLTQDTRFGQLGLSLVDRLRGENALVRAERFAAWNKEQRGLEVGAGQVDWSGLRRVPLDRFAQLLADLEREVRADGAQLVLVAMPRHPDEDRTRPVLLEYTRTLREQAPALGVALYDAHREIGAALAAGARWDTLFVDNYHPSPEGQELIARGVLELVLPLVLQAMGVAGER
jgi:lysophospholipase L1-like esterase